MQATPSQGAPHGSFDAPQLGGVFCHSFFRDSSAAAATTTWQSSSIRKYLGQRGQKYSYGQYMDEDHYYPISKIFINF